VWIDDLSPYGDSPRILAVGWLERGHEYPEGEVSAEVYATLENLLVAPWQPSAAAGAHQCDLCVFTAEKSGTKNVLIPGEGRVYVAPELILHYMNAHRYQPPVEFCRAVTTCPPRGSPEYRRALLSSGGPGFLAAMRAA
jgi:hypothetical protein